MVDGVTLVENAAWVLRVLSVDVSRGEATPKPTQNAVPTNQAAEEIPGLAAWQLTREVAVKSLNQLEAAFRSMDEPEVPEAIILVDAIRAHLMARPERQQQVQELAPVYRAGRHDHGRRDGERIRLHYLAAGAAAGRALPASATRVTGVPAHRLQRKIRL
jgi:hypothetical protein